MSAEQPFVKVLDGLGSDDVSLVGGKNASLGEMMQNLRKAGIQVPAGFATTARAYWAIIESNGLRDRIAEQIKRFRNDETTLAETGKGIRQLFLDAEFPAELRDAIKDAYRQLAQQTGREQPSVAVRSSATAEDLPEASFAGQLETFLNVKGEEALLDACRRCYASLFTDRAISYRENNNFDHLEVALSVGVQKMVRSDQGGAGVMFSIDTETGFPDAVLINGAWGLGESVVQGSVDPDEYMVFKPLLDKSDDYKPIIEKTLGGKAKKIIYAEQGDSPVHTVDTSPEEQMRFVLSDDEIVQLGRWAVAIEQHYAKPMDMEWAKDGETGEMFIVQARPETVQSQKQAGSLKSYRLRQKGKELVSGDAIGDAIAVGKVCKLESPDQIDQFEENGVLVTGMTDPDWVPIMKKASAIVAEHGGRTSHAAIVSRELSLPAVVGTGNATQVLEDGQQVTVSCAEGDKGFVYEGSADYEVNDVPLDDIPETRTKIMLILANPAASMRWWQLPSDGVGLARMEFIINNLIKIHPMALVRWEKLKEELDAETRDKINQLTRAYDDKRRYFVDTLAYGIARIAAAHYPKQVIVRTSDFKTNEYARLIGGEGFEPSEENPMLGWRGASRYYSDDYREGFKLECQALKKVREEMGLDNVTIMIPFCRTLDEADKVSETLAEQGLRRGENGLQVYVMGEIPANIVQAEQFAERFDGFSIGSNDLTQLMLGVDRDSDRLSELFDERNPAVKDMIARLIASAHKAERKVGLCGQAPSDHPDFANFLVHSGIDSIAVIPDSFVAVKRHVAEAEQNQT
jgi:pyruvate,water dikinase